MWRNRTWSVHTLAVPYGIPPSVRSETPRLISWEPITFCELTCAPPAAALQLHSLQHDGVGMATHGGPRWRHPRGSKSRELTKAEMTGSGETSTCDTADTRPVLEL